MPDKGEHYLFPGHIFAHTEPHLVTTVLGSCVSVCLWDSVLRQGGMNHYMLPLWNGEGLASPKYGTVAIPRLIEVMLELGSRRSDLVAKVFGGGDILKVTNGIMNVGQRNVDFALKTLQDEGIPILVSNVRGIQGRKLIFDTEDGAVFMKKLKQISGNSDPLGQD